MPNGNFEILKKNFCSSGTLGTSPSPSEGYLSSTPQSLPTFHHPSHALLMDNNFTQQAYHKYHSRCLKGVYQDFLFVKCTML